MSIDLRPAVDALEEALRPWKGTPAKPGSASEAHIKWVNGVVNMLKIACNDEKRGDGEEDPYVLRF